MRAYERLLDYVKVYTTSDPESGTHPSAAREFDLAHKLVEVERYGVTVAMVNRRVTENRLADIAGKTRNVPENCELLSVARRMGVCLG